MTAKAHGGPIDITGITVATVDDKVRLQAVSTYFDPLEMFRQIAPNGVVNKQVVDKKMDRSAALDTEVPSHDGVKIAEEHNSAEKTSSGESCPFSGASMSAALSGCPVINFSRPTGSSPKRSGEQVHPHPHTMERAVKPVAGDAVVAEPQAEETKLTHREMSSITQDEVPTLMNGE